MRILLSLFALSLAFSSFSQDPAGECLFIDYEAFQDDGILRYVNCGNDESFNPGAELTIQCWLRINDSNWNQKLCGKTNGNFNSGYVFAIDQGDVYGEIWNPSLNEIHDGFIPPVQLWYHLAITFEAGNVMRGYVNGEMVQEVNVSANDIATNMDPFVIGIAPWDLSNFQSFGQMDELRIFSIALTEEEIKEDLFKQLDGNDGDMVAYYPFNDESGTEVADMSMNDNTGTLVGLTESDWAPSRAPIGDVTIMGQENVVGLWNGVTFADPRFVITENGLSLSASDMADLDYCVYGHDGGAGTQTDDLPAGAPANFKSAARSWYGNALGEVQATLTFNLVNAAAGGETLDQNQPANHYTLCFREDESSDWQFLAQADDLIGDVAVFEDFVMLTGYYTVGVGDAPATISVGVSEQNLVDWSFFPNPADETITLNFTQVKSGNILINILDRSGKLVRHEMLNSASQHTLNVSDLASGTYTLRVETNSGVDYKSLIVK